MKIEKINIRLDGVAPLMFDRFIDHSKEDRPAEQKFYLIGENDIVIPSENIMSFIVGNDPPGCAKAFEGKKGKDYIRMAQSHISIDTLNIPITRDDKPLRFKGFSEKKGITKYMAAGRTKSGTMSIKQEIKPRPLIHCPWEMSFSLNLVENPLIDNTKLFNWFIKGGILMALGTFRPRFGRFEVVGWS